MTKLRNLKIVPFRSVDTWQLVYVIDRVCADTPWMQTTRFEPTPAWKHALDNEHCPHHLLALARVGDQVIGWCRLFPLSDSQPGPVELGIGVLNPYRRQGVGTSMMIYAGGWARARLTPEIILATHVQNEPAMRLFKKFGFREKERKEKLLAMGLDVDLGGARTA